MPKKTLPLSFRQKLGFGILDLAGNAIFTIVSFWLLNFLTDTLRLRPELAGTALLLGRVWDAVTDPLMGWISDRTRTRWGRRRPYLLAGGITTAASLVILFLPVHSSNQILLFFWAAGSYSLLCTASTVLLVPYFALTPELTKDYRERSVLNGFRMTSAVVGTLLGAGAFLPLLSLFPDRNTAWPFTAAIFGLITVALSLVTF
jgi:GPH family glycoside/pentoside/hexuronide:cation symporter